MYYVPLTPAEVWIGIAVFFVVVAIVAIRKRLAAPHRMTDEEYRAACERDREKNAKLSEHIDKVLAEHEAEVKRITGE